MWTGYHCLKKILCSFVHFSASVKVWTYIRMSFKLVRWSFDMPSLRVLVYVNCVDWSELLYKVHLFSFYREISYPSIGGCPNLWTAQQVNSLSVRHFSWCMSHFIILDFLFLELDKPYIHLVGYSIHLLEVWRKIWLVSL